MEMRKRKSHKLKTQVIKTARQFFNSKGFDHTTINDIAVQLNISTDQFYEYFNSLDEVLEIVWSDRAVEH